MGGVPPYLVLLRVGFAMPAALLQQRCALTAPFHPYPAHSRKSVCEQDALSRMSGAVCFLWHFPSSGLESALPDVIRHTALWSSDFPPRPFSKEPTCFTLLPEWAGRPSGPAANTLIIFDLIDRWLAVTHVTIAALAKYGKIHHLLTSQMLRQQTDDPSQNT